MSCPEIIEVTSEPPISGNIWRPDVVGLAPCTTCRKSGRYVTEPNRAKPTIKPTAEVTQKARLRKSLKGSTGSSALPSAKRKATKETTAITISPMMKEDDQGYSVPPRSVTRMIEERAIARRAAPT